jgi:hypothetical protein
MQSLSRSLETANRDSDRGIQVWLRRSKKDESKKALKESVEELRRTEEKEPEVTEVSRAFRIIRERNHFAEELKSIMGGSH